MIENNDGSIAKLGDVIDLRKALNAGLDQRREANKKLGEIAASVLLKVQVCERAKREYYVWRSELEPHLTQEEKDFIGQFWKAKLRNGKKDYFTKSRSIQRILLKKFELANEGWRREQIGDLPQVKFIR